MKNIKVYSIYNDYGLINLLSNKYNNFNYTIINNPYENETDLCFFDMGNFMDDYKDFELRKINNLKGKPKIIINTAESASNGWSHMIPNKINTLSFYQQDRYTMSHNIDSNQNCFQPYILSTDFIEVELNQKINRKKIKTKFCNIITSDASIQREFYINYISNNYKTVDSFGHFCHNTYKDSYSDEELNEIIPSYKFSLVIENELSFDNEIYLTEKISRAFNWGTVPIYWGAKNANKIINENAFINITDLSPEDALNLIKKYDEDDNLYNEMLNQQKIFNIYNNAFDQNRDEFVKHIIFDDEEIQLIHETYNIGIFGFDKEYIKKMLINQHYNFNIIENINKFKDCDIIICNNLNISNKLINKYKLKVLFVCYNNDYDCGFNNIKENLFTISNTEYNMHNLYIPYEFFTIKYINQFNLYNHIIEHNNPINYNDFNYYEYYRKTIIYFIVDIIKDNMNRKICK